MDNLQKVTHNNIKVLTTKQLAGCYGTTSQVISYNFNYNKDKYVENKHYFILKGKSKNEFCNRREFHDGSKQASELYLWTERGALLHAKSLNTDKAWDTYDLLIETYFKVKEQYIKEKELSGIEYAKRQLELSKRLVQLEEDKIKLLEANKENEQKLIEQKPKVEFFNAVTDSKTAISMGDTAKILNYNNLGRNKLFEILREKKILMNDNVPYQEYIDREYFRVIEQKYHTANGETRISIKTLVFQKGLDYIKKVLDEYKEVKL